MITPDSATLLMLREEALELAQARGLPADTIAAAGMAAQYVDEGRPVVLRGLSLGNRTGVDLALVPLSASTGLPSGTEAGYVLVAPVGWTAYPFDRIGYLAGSYVAEHLRPPSGRGNPCDGSALALVLGIALGRPAIVQCDCEIHQDPLA